MVRDQERGILSRRHAVKLGGAAAIGAILLRQGANAQDATPATCPSLTMDEQKEIAKQFFTAWEGVVDHPEVLAALLADDYTHHWGLGTDSIGAEETIARITTYMTAIPDQKFTIQAMYGEGDTVIVRWTATGTQSGQLGAISPSTTSFEYSGINILRFACGKIAESWNETDQLGRLVQQGTITDDELGTVGTPTP